MICFSYEPLTRRFRLPTIIDIDTNFMFSIQMLVTLDLGSLEFTCEASTLGTHRHGHAAAAAKILDAKISDLYLHHIRHPT